MRRRATSLFLACALAGCQRDHVDIERPPGAWPLTRAEEEELQRVAETAFRDAKSRLGGLPPRLTLIVRFGKDVLPETGETGAAGYPGNISLTLDPDRDLTATIRTFVRPCLLHELHHLARQSRVPNRRRLLERVVSEGLATAFERDVSPSTPPWGASSPELDAWTRDVLAAADSTSIDDWFPGPAARRFIGHRVGVSLVDRAGRAHRLSPAEMTFLSADEVVRLATR